MAEWVYKATRARRSFDDTLDLVMIHKFLCRSAYENEEEKRSNRVQEVKRGDVIHFYYARRRGVAEIGSYRVVDDEAYPGRFSKPVAGTALVGVLEEPQNAALIAFLERKNPEGTGYERDPVLGVFTGWALDRVGKAPRFDQQRMLPGPMTNLWHYPDPDLPKRGAK